MATSPGNLPLTLIRGIEFESVILQCRDANVLVTGTIVPDATGLYTPHGTFGSSNLYILEGAPSYFIYFHPIVQTYIIASTLTTGALVDGWVPALPQDGPNGDFIGTGAYTGTATASNNPVDLTNYTPEAQVRRNPRSSVILDLNPSVTDAVNGEVTIPAIPTADTTLLTSFGVFYWDFILKTPYNERLGPFVSGSFTISDSITQEGAAPPEL